jgi:uroporphyrinogen decarboxylase
MAAMTARERVMATFRGEPTDRPPLVFWQHAPGRDLAADTLTPAVLGFQRDHDLDIVKITPAGSYQALDYGVTIQPADDDLGTTRVVTTPIHSPADWTTLPRADFAFGAIAEQIETVRRVRAAVGDTPVIQTLFSPLTVAARLAGGTFDEETLDRPELLVALHRITQDVIAAGQAMLAAGADGFFFASQHASPATMPRRFYDRVGEPFDVIVAQSLKAAGAAILIGHLHGNDPYVDIVPRLGVNALSWHDRETPPTLEAAPVLPVAGINHRGAVLSGTPEAIAAEVRDAVDQTGGRIVLAPGCTFPLTVPLSNLRALRRAVDELRS